MRVTDTGTDTYILIEYGYGCQCWYSGGYELGYGDFFQLWVWGRVL